RISPRCGSINSRLPRPRGETQVVLRSIFTAAAVTLALGGAAAALAEEPKRGGTLTYMIAADAPPSLDGHREQTFAMIHPVAPFYSLLIRINPQNPASSDDF